MTLYRQLLIATLILFILIFSIVWLEKLQSTRTFLMNQLESHAQDTATSLGLSLSPVLAVSDLPTAETMMNAVFDRGYYRLVRLAKMDGTTLVERRMDVKSEGVPNWFVRLIPLETPISEALVMAGWRQAGQIFVESHPGYAYMTLWDTVVQVTVFLSGLAVVFLAVGGVVLRLLLRPLKRVEQQAEAICRREYQLQEPLPRTRELRQVVESMNRMVNKVKDMFREQAQLAEKLRASAYSDALTGLGNRRYINGQIDAGLAPSEDSVKGGLLLIEVNDLQGVNEARGYVGGDELLKRVAEVVKQVTKDTGTGVPGRLTGGTFVVYLPETSPEDVEELAETLSSAVARIGSEDLGCSDNVANIGGVVYGASQPPAQLLAEADTALGGARKQGPNRWQVNTVSEEAAGQVKGRGWWKEILGRILKEKDIQLYCQNIVHCSDRSGILHVEVFSRIALDGDEVVSAGVFIPLAEQLNLAARLDRIVLEKVFELADGVVPTRVVAVNLSPHSLADEGFCGWLLEQLKARPASSPKYIFEFPEFGSVLNLDSVRHFAAAIRKYGHDIGLDHFGRSFGNFGYLQSLKPEYVKIDRGYTAELKQAYGDSQFFIGALCGVAHSLDIRVIAEGVESEEELAMYRELNVDAVQGYLISRPQALLP